MLFCYFKYFHTLYSMPFRGWPRMPMWILKRLREVWGRMGGLQRPEKHLAETRIWASKLWLGSLHPWIGVRQYMYLYILTLSKNVIKYWTYKFVIILLQTFNAYGEYLDRREYVVPKFYETFPLFIDLWLFKLEVIGLSHGGDILNFL